MGDMTKLHPRLQLKAAQLKEACSKQGISILFSEGLRTAAQQDALYAQGRTKPGNIITNAKGSSYSSQHQWGIAVDFYLNMDIDGDGTKSDDAFNNSSRLFERVGELAKTLGLGWGGDWTSIKDRPHLYLPDWGSTTSQLKQLYGTPDQFMKSWENISAAGAEQNPSKTVQGTVITDSDPLLIRETPDGRALSSIPKGASVEVLEQGAKWHKVRYQGITGYSAAKYISLNGASQPQAGYVGECTGNQVRVRATPDASGNIIRHLNKGNLFRVLGVSGNWTHVSIEGTEGYISSDYVKRT